MGLLSKAKPKESEPELQSESNQPAESSPADEIETIMTEIQQIQKSLGQSGQNVQAQQPTEWPFPADSQSNMSSEVQKPDTLPKESSLQVQTAISMTIVGEMTFKLKCAGIEQEVTLCISDQLIRIQLPNGAEFKIPVLPKSVQ